MTDWQPIETAPKDGTKIVAWDKYNGIYWDTHYLEAHNGWQTPKYCSLMHPTHWAIVEPPSQTN